MLDNQRDKLLERARRYDFAEKTLVRPPRFNTATEEVKRIARGSRFGTQRASPCQSDEKMKQRVERYDKRSVFAYES